MKSNTKKFIGILMLVVLIMVSAIIILKATTEKIETHDNVTIVINESNITNNIIKPGKFGFWDFMIFAIFVICQSAIIIYFVKKYFERPKSTVNKRNEKKLQEFACKRLNEMGYEIEETKAKWLHYYFGTDKESFPCVAFIFVMAGADFYKKTGHIHKSQLVSCQLNIQSMLVSNPRTGISPEQILKELKDQRIGKYGVQIVPGKPDKAPALFGEIRPTLNVDATMEDLTR